MKGVSSIVSALWQYRFLVRGMVERDFRAQYLNSIFGTCWAILGPLSQILVYTLIFSAVMKAKIPGIDNSYGYSIYLCSALLPWNYFVETLNRVMNVFVGNANLLKKMNFPRVTLPLYAVLSASVGFLITFALFLGFLTISRSLPGLAILALLPLLLLQQAIAVGLGVFLGVLNVFFRDVSHAFSIIIQFWFWLTPIVYPVATIPERFRWIVLANPMYPVVDAYHGIFLHGRWPSLSAMVPVALWAILFLGLGYFAFTKLSKEMVDEF